MSKLGLLSQEQVWRYLGTVCYPRRPPEWHRQSHVSHNIWVYWMTKRNTSDDLQCLQYSRVNCMACLHTIRCDVRIWESMTTTTVQEKGNALRSEFLCGFAITFGPYMILVEDLYHWLTISAFESIVLQRTSSLIQPNCFPQGALWVVLPLFCERLLELCVQCGWTQTHTHTLINTHIHTNTHTHTLRLILWLQDNLREIFLRYFLWHILSECVCADGLCSAVCVCVRVGSLISDGLCMDNRICFRIDVGIIWRSAWLTIVSGWNVDYMN